MKFITVRVKAAIVHHGYDKNHQELVSRREGEEFADKLVAIDRIQSVTEKYILVSSLAGTTLYWEYEGSLADITRRLSLAGLVVG